MDTYNPINFTLYSTQGCSLVPVGRGDIRFQDPMAVISLTVEAGDLPGSRAYEVFLVGDPALAKPVPSIRLGRFDLPENKPVAFARQLYVYDILGSGYPLSNFGGVVITPVDGKTGPLVAAPLHAASGLGEWIAASVPGAGCADDGGPPPWKGEEPVEDHGPAADAEPGGHQPLPTELAGEERAIGPAEKFPAAEEPLPTAEPVPPPAEEPTTLSEQPPAEEPVTLAEKPPAGEPVTLAEQPPAEEPSRAEGKPPAEQAPAPPPKKRLVWNLPPPLTPKTPAPPTEAAEKK